MTILLLSLGGCRKCKQYGLEERVHQKISFSLIFSMKIYCSLRLTLINGSTPISIHSKKRNKPFVSCIEPSPNTPTPPEENTGLKGGSGQSLVCTYRQNKWAWGLQRAWTSFQTGYPWLLGRALNSGQTSGRKEGFLLLMLWEASLVPAIASRTSLFPCRSHPPQQTASATSQDAPTMPPAGIFTAEGHRWVCLCASADAILRPPVKLLCLLLERL